MSIEEWFALTLGIGIILAIYIFPIPKRKELK